MAEERGLSVDVEGFNIAMEEARQKARTARSKVCSALFFVLKSDFLITIITLLIRWAAHL